MLLPLLGQALRAQESLGVAAHVLFYGDNTEFRNPFREGETIFGAAVRVAATADLNERVTLALGVFGNHRFGSADAFEQVRPVVSLTLRGARSTFVFGTLPPPSPVGSAGPDRGGPHGLLPALQRETLAFDRPYEAGLLWTRSSPVFRHDAWLNWQRVNTRAHRERFDAGVNAEAKLPGPFSLPIQVHVVHEGGQLFASGPVRDSLAAAAGLRVAGRTGRVDLAALEVLGVASRAVPDRGHADLTRNGAGFFGRGSIEESGWRLHVIFWRGRAFVHDEGDPNYLSRRRDGTEYRGTRDYAEAGLTRTFRPAPDMSISVAARLHRVERHYEYSYRILAAAGLRWP